MAASAVTQSHRTVTPIAKLTGSSPGLRRCRDAHDMMDVVARVYFSPTNTGSPEREEEARNMTKARKIAATIALVLTIAAAGTFAFLNPPVAASQTRVETYSATVIPTEGLSGATTRILIRITAYTSDAEKKQLREAFSKDKPDEGLALLKTMSKGRITPEGQPGRIINAAFVREVKDGKRLILITERVLSEYERSAYQQEERARAAAYPLTIVRIQFDKDGRPTSGEVFPGAKVSVAADGLVDVETQAKNPAVMIDILRQ